MLPVSAVSLLALLALLGVNLAVPLQAAGPEAIVSEPFRPRSGEGSNRAAKPLFTRLGPDVTRIGFASKIADWHKEKRLYLSAFAAGGLAVGDLDGDGLADLFVSGGAEENRLYLQGENLTFLDITAGLAIQGEGRWSAGAAIIDIDGDGDNDLYVCYYDQPNQLFINHLSETGKLSFTEEAARFKLDAADASLLPIFADYDLDGDLDLYLVMNQLIREGGRPASAPLVEAGGKGGTLTVSGDLGRYYTVTSKPDASGKWSYVEQGRPDRLLRNDKGVFKDVTTAAGLTSAPAIGNSASWWDYDEDGFPDLFVSNEDAPGRLFHNSGKGTFTDATGTVLPPGSKVSRGITVLDANGDGHTDLCVSTVRGRTHYQRASAAAPAGDHNQLFLSSGSSRFTEAGWISGVGCTGSTWSVKSGDYDLDGREDLFFTNGCARNIRHGDLPKVGHEQLVGRTAWDNYESAASESLEANMAFRSAGTRFEDVSTRWGLDLVGMSYACAQADLDNDGDLDLVVTGLNDALYLFRNDSSAGNSIRVRLRGTSSNRQGLGAKISVTTSAGRQVREIVSGGGEGVHFGLGGQASVSLLQVQWAGGNLQEFRDLPANRLYTITEAPRKAPARRPPPPPPFFAARDSLAAYADSPSPAHETNQEPFAALSRFPSGPGQAWGDVDGDGRPDLYLGAGLGNPGRLLLNRTSPGASPAFSLSAQRLFNTHAERQDTAVLFFDANGDGSLDLYTGSGALGQEEGSSTLRDRLYLNNGSGVFDDASYRLPDVREHTSTVCAADFDQDGDLDVFVGYYAMPGRFPHPAGGRLFRNEGKEFRDATNELGPSLAAAGLITSALWSDLDGDGWPDLITAQAHGPIQIHVNIKGKLGNPTGYSGLQDFTGQWTGLTAADLDGDGDIDLAAANSGLNAPFPASTAAPAVLFAGEWEGPGHIALLEAYQEHGIWLPRRGLEFWRQALPSLFPTQMTYHDFAKTSIDGLFGLDRLRQAILLKDTESRSGVFYNDGTGRFAFVPFPDAAQLAPAYGIVLADFDLDGQADCYLAQNRSEAMPGDSPLCGGLGVLLRGVARPVHQKERFTAMTAGESGIQIPGEGRSAAGLDLNGDGLPDLVTGINGEAPIVLVNQTKPVNRPLRVFLRGPQGNPGAAGAKIRMDAPGLPRQTIEVHAGEGFLSSVSGEHILAAPPSSAVIKVTWPDGSASEQVVPADAVRLEIPFAAPAPPVPAPPAPAPAARAR